MRPPTVGTQLVGDSPDPILLTYRPISLLSSPHQLNAKRNPSQVLINIGDSLEQNRSHVIANFFCAQSITFFCKHCTQAQPTCISCKRESGSTAFYPVSKANPGPPKRMNFRKTSKRPLTHPPSLWKTMLRFFWEVLQFAKTIFG